MMKLRLGIATIWLVVLGSGAGLMAQIQVQSTHDLVKDVVYNELQDRQSEDFWAYRIQKRVGRQSVEEQQIETKFGPVYTVLMREGKPLSPAQQHEENSRLAELLRDPSKQARVKAEHDGDEQNLERLMKSMPDAFNFTYDGVEEGKLRLRFEPNPSFTPSTYVGRVYHALAGEVWIDPQHKRLVRLQGHIIDQVDFGFGLLGRVDKGGTFEIHRQQVSQEHWKTNLADVHISGRMVLFKSIAKDEHEVRSNFQPVSNDLNLKQAIDLLTKANASLNRKTEDPGS
jgi:hypothetical protein